MGDSAPGPWGTKSVRGSASSTGDSWGGPRCHNQWADCVGEAHKGKFKPSGVHLCLHPTAHRAPATCKGCAQGRVWQIPAGPQHTPPCRPANTYFLFLCLHKICSTMLPGERPQTQYAPSSQGIPPRVRDVCFGLGPAHHQRHMWGAAGNQKAHRVHTAETPERWGNPPKTMTRRGMGADIKFLTQEQFAD